MGCCLSAPREGRGGKKRRKQRNAPQQQQQASTTEGAVADATLPDRGDVGEHDVVGKQPNKPRQRGSSHGAASGSTSVGSNNNDASHNARNNGTIDRSAEHSGGRRTTEEPDRSVPLSAMALNPFAPPSSLDAASPPLPQHRKDEDPGAASRSHSLVPIGLLESATSSSRLLHQQKHRVGQARGNDVAASDCSNAGSDRCSGHGPNERRGGGANEGGGGGGFDGDSLTSSSSCTDGEDDDGEGDVEGGADAEALIQDCPEHFVDAASLPMITHLLRIGALKLDESADAKIGHAFRTKMKFRDVEGWIAEIGAVPAAVLSLSHHDHHRGPNEQVKLTARMLEQNHKLLLQLRSRTTAAPTPVVITAGLPGGGGGGQFGLTPNQQALQMADVAGSHARPSVAAAAEGPLSGVTSPSHGRPSTPTYVVLPSHALHKDRGVLTPTDLQAQLAVAPLLSGGSCLDDDAARRFSRGSNKNRVPDRNASCAADDFDVTNFYEELEDEERRLSTIKESSSDEDF